LYVSGGDGYLDVLQQQNANTLARSSDIATAAGARTSLFVAERNGLYFADRIVGVGRPGSESTETR
jgi:hypothetical protein